MKDKTQIEAYPDNATARFLGINPDGSRRPREVHRNRRGEIRMNWQRVPWWKRVYNKVKRHLRGTQ